MLDQSVFTETIHEVAEIIRTSATPLSKEEILSYFKEMELNEQQENMVLEFLLTPHEEEEAEEETEEAEGGEQEADLLMIIKYLERIGDHATNIAEWVLFYITGEHPDVSQL